VRAGWVTCIGDAQGGAPLAKGVGGHGQALVRTVQRDSIPRTEGRTGP